MVTPLGISSYPRTLAGAYSTNIIDDIIDVMNTRGLNMYRMSIYYTVADSTRDAMIQHFIDNKSSNHNLLVCRHVYDPGGSLSDSDWTNITAWVLDVCATFSESDLWGIEPVNECGDSDLGTRMQTLITAVRTAGYTHNIVFNKWNQSWSDMVMVDAQNKTYCGYHYYFNSWSVDGAITQMNTALGLGIKLFNTEIGADYNEASAFSSSEVQEVNDFMDWCYDQEIGNTVWMRYGLQNNATYDTLGLEWPASTTQEPDPQTSSGLVVTATSGTVTAIQNAVNTVIAGGGGTVKIPSGTFAFAATATNYVNITQVPTNGIIFEGAGIDQTILQVPSSTSDSDTTMFSVDANGYYGKVRFTGLTLKANSDRTTSTAGYIGILIQSCTDFRVDHCSFYDMGDAAISVYDATNMYGTSGGTYDLVSQGVVDHCEFYDIYKPLVTGAGNGYGYGVFVARASHYLWSATNIYPSSPWTTNDGFGNYYKCTYIEDCTFRGCRHAVTGNFAGAYCLRYSTISDNRASSTASTTGHPVRSNVLGQHYCEIYSNTFQDTGYYDSTTMRGIHVEGGSALVYDNTITGLQYCYQIGDAETAGQTFSPKGETQETYIWDNTETSYSNMLLEIDNTGTGGEGAPVEGTQYWTDVTGTYSTAQVQALVDAENYLAYTYPHPLTVEETTEDSEPPIPPPTISWYYINVSSSVGGTVSPAGWHQITGNTPTYVIATPNTDYVFSHFLVNGTSKSSNPVKIEPAEDRQLITVKAYFNANPPEEPDDPEVPDPEYYNVNIGTSTGVSTDLSDTQTVLVGQTLVVTATLDNNYRFNYWLYDASAVQHGSKTFIKTEFETGQHTLLPVVQKVVTPAPTAPVSLPNASVAPLAPNKMLSQILKQQEVSMKPIDLGKILKKLKL